MSDTARSQSQHSSVVASVDAQVARLEAFYAQLGELEAKALEQTTTALDESARLSRETLAYGASLAAEWRKASLEAARRTAQLMVFPVFPFGS